MQTSFEKREERSSTLLNSMSITYHHCLFSVGTLATYDASILPKADPTYS
jgi:hypothetical protein